MVGAKKIERWARLVALYAQVNEGEGGELKVGVLVDNSDNAEALCAALEAAGAPPVAAYVEVDVGQKRCGVDCPEAAADLAELLERSLAKRGLYWGGLHAYHGANQHTALSERTRIFEEDVLPMVQRTVSSLANRGLSPAQITGGGTGSFELEAQSGLYTEVQPGQLEPWV